MASVVRRALALLAAPRNRVAFAVRRRLRWRRGEVLLRGEDGTCRFDWLAPGEREAACARERELAARYDLDALRARATRLVHAENVALLDGLERAFAGVAIPHGRDGIRRAVDVGSGAFAYATALQRFLSRHGEPVARRVELRGVEIDGYARHRDGHARVDHARANAALAGDGVCYEVADFLELRLPEQDVVTLCHPFVLRYALLQWGLPLALFRPRELLRRAVQTLRPGGILFVVNQTANENDRVRQLLGGAPVRLCARVPFATTLVPYGERTQDRVATVWRRLSGARNPAPNGTLERP